MLNWPWKKKDYSPKAVLNASTMVFDTSGLDGAKQWPFSYIAAVEQCRGWVYRCAYGNAQRVASTPLRLYAKKPMSGKKALVWDSKSLSRAQFKHVSENASPQVRLKSAGIGEYLVQLNEHPALDLLTKGNKWLDGYNMMTQLVAMLELTGNGYWHPVMSRELQRPVEIWPMLPQWTWVCPGEGDEFIKGYSYGPYSARKRVTFAADEVLHCRYPSVRDYYYGMGKVEAAWEILGLTRSQRIANKALFDNGLNPGMVVSVDGLSNDDQARTTEARMNTLFRGVRNAGKLLLIGGKTQVHPMAISPKDIATNENAMEEIAACFGYPMSKLKGNDPNRANAEAGDVGWLKDTITPICSTVEQWLNQSYLPLFGPEVAENAFFAFDNPVPDETNAKTDRLIKLGTNAMMTTNEIRTQLGEEEIEGGDELRFNGQSLAAKDSPPAAPTLPPGAAKHAKIVRYP